MKSFLLINQNRSYFFFLLIFYLYVCLFLLFAHFFFIDCRLYDIHWLYHVWMYVCPFAQWNKKKMSSRTTIWLLPEILTILMKMIYWGAHNHIFRYFSFFLIVSEMNLGNEGLDLSYIILFFKWNKKLSREKKR
jgi:hypothetical protein